MSSGQPSHTGTTMSPGGPSGGGLSRKAKIISWIAQIGAAAILGQTLFFKFTGAPESVEIFRTLGAEPWGRLATGVMELIAVVLLLSGRWAAFGGVLAAGLMFGAIGSHLTKLGIEVQGDGGLLFALAVITLTLASIVVVLRRGQLWGLATQLGLFPGAARGPQERPYP
jgi:uncharacterized membrane protein YphA (DoxX/SURF4 family)